MPTENRIEATLNEISEILESVGDNVTGIEGPQEIEDEDGRGHRLYFLYGEADGSLYYLTASTEYEHMAAFYAYGIERRIGDIAPDSAESLIEVDSESHEDEDEKDINRKIGAKIISNTPNSTINQAKFNISAYGSSDIVDIEFEEGNFGTFRTARPLYPYSEPVSLREVNDRISTAVNMGRRARRYIEASFYVSEETIDGEEQLVLNIAF